MRPYDFTTDVVVVGAGPIGLFSVFALGMLEMRCHVIDILEKPGGQCMALYPEKPIYDVPGIPVISGADLVHGLLEQGSRFNPVFHMGHRVTKVAKDQEGLFVVQTSGGLYGRCRAVIIAAGNGAISPKKLDIENIENFENKSLFYSVDDVQSFSESDIMVVGGGNSAADWAIMLSDLANKIYLVHRRDRFTCFPDSENKIRDLVTAGRIELLTKYQVASLNGQDGFLSSVMLEPTELDSGDNISVEISKLLVFLGLHSDVEDIKSWGINVAKFGRVTVNQVRMDTNLLGVFAIGDIADYPNKLRLISTGFGEASAAAYAIRELLFNTPLHFEYSTHKFSSI